MSTAGGALSKYGGKNWKDNMVCHRSLIRRGNKAVMLQSVLSTTSRDGVNSDMTGGFFETIVDLEMPTSTETEKHG